MTEPIPWPKQCPSCGHKTVGTKRWCDRRGACHECEELWWETRIRELKAENARLRNPSLCEFDHRCHGCGTIVVWPWDGAVFHNPPLPSGWVWTGGFKGLNPQGKKLCDECSDGQTARSKQ